MLWQEQKPKKLDTLECYETLYRLASEFRIESYLEVGVREGASLLCVVAKEPEIVEFATRCLSNGLAVISAELVRRIAEVFTMRNPNLQLHLFDNWSYYGCGDGHKRVERLLKEGFRTSNYAIYDGDSKTTLPQFKGKVDLAFVDGDHTVEGAKTDLENVADHAKIIVFHDLYHPEWTGLEEVFINFCKRHDLPYFIVGRRVLGTGVAFNIWQT